MKKVKVVSRYIGDYLVAVCVLNEKGEELHRFLVRNYCCEHKLYEDVLQYLNKNDMIEVHNEVV